FVARFASGDSTLLFNVVEGAVRLVLFIGYIWAIGRSKEIARVFEFHGAEHMTIHAYEAGDPLTLEAVAKYDPEHPRCGTSFLLIVILGSIVVFSLVHQPGWLWLVGTRILGIPLIAGLAYELLRFSGLGRVPWLSQVLAAPGLWLQKLTTNRPAADQIEVAIASMVTALEEEQLEGVLGRGAVPESALAARQGAISGCWTRNWPTASPKSRKHSEPSKRSCRNRRSPPIRPGSPSWASDTPSSAPSCGSSKTGGEPTGIVEKHWSSPRTTRTWHSS